MADVDGDSPIGGPDTHVEIDETLIGAMARSGDVVTAVVPNQRKVTLQPFVESKFATGGVVHTDELNSYRGLGAAGYRLACRDHERL